MIAGSRADHVPHNQSCAIAGDHSDVRIATSSRIVAFFSDALTKHRGSCNLSAFDVDLKSNTLDGGRNVLFVIWVPVRDVYVPPYRYVILRDVSDA